MAAGRKLGDIHCPSCDSDSFLMAIPVYEGFKRVGDSRQCSGCGYTFGEEEEISFIETGEALPDLFADVEKEEIPRLLGDKNDVTFCRHCQEYVENPFTQRCMLHKKAVKATDTCLQFRRRR